MTKEDLATRTKVTPEPGRIYRHSTSGSCYRCTGIQGNGTATLRSEGGWTFTAHGCGVYEDGRIDWDYSTGGRFE